MLKKLLRLACTLCAFAMLLTSMPALASDNDIANLEISGTINCSKLKLRATPSAEARTLGT